MARFLKASLVLLVFFVFLINFKRIYAANYLAQTSYATPITSEIKKPTSANSTLTAMKASFKIVTGFFADLKKKIENIVNEIFQSPTSKRLSSKPKKEETIQNGPSINLSIAPSPFLTVIPTGPSWQHISESFTEQTCSVLCQNKGSNWSCQDTCQECYYGTGCLNHGLTFTYDNLLGKESYDCSYTIPQKAETVNCCCQYNGPIQEETVNIPPTTIPAETKSSIQINPFQKMINNIQTIFGFKSTSVPAPNSQTFNGQTTSFQMSETESESQTSEQSTSQSQPSPVVFYPQINPVEKVIKNIQAIFGFKPMSTPIPTLKPAQSQFSSQTEQVVNLLPTKGQSIIQEQASFVPSPTPSIVNNNLVIIPSPTLIPTFIESSQKTTFGSLIENKIIIPTIPLPTASSTPITQKIGFQSLLESKTGDSNLSQANQTTENQSNFSSALPTAGIALPTSTISPIKQSIDKASQDKSQKSTTEQINTPKSAAALSLSSGWNNNLSLPMAISSKKIIENILQPQANCQISGNIYVSFIKNNVKQTYVYGYSTINQMIPSKTMFSLYYSRGNACKVPVENFD